MFGELRPCAQQREPSDREKRTSHPKETTSMYCSSCGAALARRTKYCKHCGTQLIAQKDAAEIEQTEKRLYGEMVDLFWVTVFGLGLILGGMVVMKRVHLSDGLIIAYMILSSTAFAINFGLSLWQIWRLAGSVKAPKATLTAEQLDTNELNPAPAQPVLEPAPSVTEHTTRSLEPVAKEQRS